MFKSQDNNETFNATEVYDITFQIIPCRNNSFAKEMFTKFNLVAQPAYFYTVYICREIQDALCMTDCLVLVISL